MGVIIKNTRQWGGLNVARYQRRSRFKSRRAQLTIIGKEKSGKNRETHRFPRGRGRLKGRGRRGWPGLEAIRFIATV